jgi:TonB family protein
MTHLFVLWFALFAAQATTPATPPPSEPPATQTTQQPAPASPDQATQPPAVQHVQPYTAKQTTTHVQTMADGTINTAVTPLQIWRDADGRNRSERIHTLPNGTHSQFITIYDPITRISMSWTVGDPSVSKVVNLLHLPKPVSQPTPITPQISPPHYPLNSESLPPQTIDGLYAVGIRYTRTIPVGHEGNDRDITTTTEVWNAQQFGIQLRYVTDDPINGKTTTETTDIQFVDPDPALFQPPADYQLKEAIPPSPDQAAPAKPPNTNPDSSGTYQRGDGITPPRVLYQPSPKFPEIAKQQKLMGVVTVSIIIDAEGKPQNVHVVHSIADNLLDKYYQAAALALDQAALDVVKKYKFAPAMKDGKPVPVYLNVEVNFRIY